MDCPNAGDSPELACVVLALRNPPALVDAVQSLLAQDAPAEVLVVNSGGGDAAATLRAAGLEVRVIECSERLLPGAARNRGIDATRAPFVAFLAADCIAERGWISARLAAHRRGAPVVASAVTNARPGATSAWASYISLFSARMPGTPPERAQRYGASYARGIFRRFGRFREDLRGGEDTEFHDRLGPETEIAWAPAVRTAHRHPERPAALFRDQFRRGVRMARAWRRLRGPGPFAVARNALGRAPRQVVNAWRWSEPHQRGSIALAAPLVALAALAYAAGALAFALTPEREEEE